jgi:hypothetical protein
MFDDLAADDLDNGSVGSGEDDGFPIERVEEPEPVEESFEEEFAIASEGASSAGDEVPNNDIPPGGASTPEGFERDDDGTLLAGTSTPVAGGEGHEEGPPLAGDSAPEVAPVASGTSTPVAGGEGHDEGPPLAGDSAPEVAPAAHPADVDGHAGGGGGLRGRGLGAAYPSWEMPGLPGRLVYDPHRKSVAAHCELPCHSILQDRCNVNRTCEESKRGLNTSKQKSQGRPIGFLLAWLAQAADHGPHADKKSHMAVRLKSDVLTHAERLSWRQRAIDAGCPFLQHERKKRDGEGEEPEGMP